MKYCGYLACRKYWRVTFLKGFLVILQYGEDQGSVIYCNRLRALQSSIVAFAFSFLKSSILLADVEKCPQGKSVSYLHQAGERVEVVVFTLYQGVHDEPDCDRDDVNNEDDDADIVDENGDDDDDL